MTLQWQQYGKWAVSDCGRYRVSENRMFCGSQFTSYSWRPIEDWAPIVIGTFERKDQALTACELSLKFGGSP